MNDQDKNAGAILQKKGFTPSNFRQGLFEDHDNTAQVEDTYQNIAVH